MSKSKHKPTLCEAELAKRLAAWVFALDASYESLPVTRLQFMHGKYPLNEKAGGGLCLEALADHLAQALAWERVVGRSALSQEPTP